MSKDALELLEKPMYMKKLDEYPSHFPRDINPYILISSGRVHVEGVRYPT